MSSNAAGILAIDNSAQLSSSVACYTSATLAEAGSALRFSVAWDVSHPTIAQIWRRKLGDRRGRVAEHDAGLVRRTKIPH